jgi:hypothetical protein
LGQPLSFFGFFRRKGNNMGKNEETLLNFDRAAAVNSLKMGAEMSIRLIIADKIAFRMFAFS